MIRNKLLLLHFLFIFFTLTSSSPPFNFTLFGTTIVDHNSITLTHHLETGISNPPYSNFGRVFHKHLIQFLDSSSNSTVSFYTRFSFKIIPPPPPYPSGDGLAFLITSEPNSLPHFCLPKSLDCKFMAVKFDTNFDQDLGDINNNHVGIKLDSIFSVASVDLNSGGINLKSGKEITAWIEYRNTEKVIKIWVGYTRKRKPESPILVAPIDLSKRLNGFMYVGFSADNGRGSGVHMLNSWYFKTTSESVSVSPTGEDEAVGSENCLICFPEDLVREEGEKVSRNNQNSYKSLLLLAITLVAVSSMIRVRLLQRLETFHAMMRNPAQNVRFRENEIDRRNVEEIGRIRRRFR